MAHWKVLVSSDWFTNFSLTKFDIIELCCTHLSSSGATIHLLGAQFNFSLPIVSLNSASPEVMVTGLTEMFRLEQDNMKHAALLIGV
jgi:hypothetical protein